MTLCPLPLNTSAPLSGVVPFEVVGGTQSGPGSFVIPGQSAPGCTFDAPEGLLLDWITLRISVNELPPLLQERLFANLDSVCAFVLDGQGNPLELRWESKRLNFDALRSDAPGLYMTVTYVGAECFFYLGASPASLTQDCNVFGSLDIRAGADAIISHARRCFACWLPHLEDWECCRLDVTGNYALPDAAMVKTALRTLLQTDNARRKATSAKNGGDTVLWSPTSDRFAGKAYHKGPHLRYLAEKEQIDLDPERLALADRLLRLELRVGSRFFREIKNSKRHPAFAGRPWHNFTRSELAGLHRAFFGPLVDGVEVRNMGRVEAIALIAAANGISEGRARAAYGTYKAIKDSGLDEVKASMAKRTFLLHKMHLLAAGYSDADLCAGNVVQFKPIRIVLAQPVSGWDDLRKAA
ncbi:phage/plasmid replication protein, II/X family [Azonexus sp. R2A61]|uniref:phage/plasmid replication protein, II/X family n=1 Tax=Azonexus sp. R2A61 TaxID=2744443 RepID=UPI001F2F6FFF|nr:phage/plasmid replication protein, II/X family [Azonexus sp. R2A61]